MHIISDIFPKFGLWVLHGEMKNAGPMKFDTGHFSGKSIRDSIN